MKKVMAAEGTARKPVTNEEVTKALRSMDDSIQKLEKAVLHPNGSQNGTSTKDVIAQRK